MRIFTGCVYTNYSEELHRDYKSYTDHKAHIDYELVKHFERDAKRERHYTRNIITAYNYKEKKEIMREEYTNPYEAENRFMEILTAYAN